MRHEKTLAHRYANGMLLSIPLTGLFFSVSLAHMIVNRTNFKTAVQDNAATEIAGLILFAALPLTQHFLGKVAKKVGVIDHPLNEDPRSFRQKADDNHWKYRIKYQLPLAVFILLAATSMSHILTIENPATHETFKYGDALKANTPLWVGSAAFLEVFYPSLNVFTEWLTKKVHNTGPLTEKGEDGTAKAFARTYGKAYAQVNLNFMPALWMTMLLTHGVGTKLMGIENSAMWDNLQPTAYGATAYMLSGLLPLAMLTVEVAKNKIAKSGLFKADNDHTPLLGMAGDTAASYNGLING